MDEEKITSFREALVCHSTVMRQLTAALLDALRAGQNILLTGERGTGKTWVAEQLHALAGREGAYIATSGALLRGDEGAARVQGYIKGAFTGAICDRAGSFELAKRGTLLIDQVEHVAPQDLQATLLRAIDPGRVSRMGEFGRERDVADVWLISTATRDLEQMVHAGVFLPDLLDRLGVRVRMPSLRERRPDIPEVVQRIASARGVEVPEHVLPTLVAHDWPGNVREVVQLMTLATVEGLSDALIERHLDRSVPQLPAAPPPTTRERIIAALRELGEATRVDLEVATGLSRSTVCYHLAGAREGGEVAMVDGFEAGRRNVRYRIAPDRPSDRPTTVQMRRCLDGELDGEEGAS